MKNSKLVLAFMALSLFLIISACSNDDEKEGEKSIVGNWTFSTVTADVIESNSSDNNSKIGTFIEKMGRSYHSNGYLIFTEDGKVTSGFSDEEGTSTSSYTFKNGILTVTDGEYIYTASASVDGNKFYLYEDLAEEFNNLKLDELLELGFKDASTKATKAIVKVTFTK